jgi:hypothetical protein
MANLHEDLYIFFVVPLTLWSSLVPFSHTCIILLNSLLLSTFPIKILQVFFNLYFTISLFIFYSLLSLIFLSFLPFELFFNSPLFSRFSFSLHHFSLFLSSFFISSSFPFFAIVCVIHFTPEQFLYACIILDQLQMKRRLWMMNLAGQKAHCQCSISNWILQLFQFFYSAISYDNTECEGHHVASTLRMKIYGQKHDDITRQIKSCNSNNPR